MSANIKSNGNGGGDKTVVIVGSDESIDEVAAMAAGLGAPPSDEVHYVPLSDFSSESFLAFSERAAAEKGTTIGTDDGDEAGTRASSQGDEREDEQTQLQSGVEYYDTEEGARKLRADREEAARLRRSRVSQRLDSAQAEDAAARERPETDERVAEKIRNVLSPAGRTNRRAQLAILCALAVVVFCVVTMFRHQGASSEGESGRNRTSSATGTKPDQQMRVTRPTDDTLHSPEGITGDHGSESRSDASTDASRLGMSPAAETTSAILGGGAASKETPILTSGAQPNAANSSGGVKLAGQGRGLQPSAESRSGSEFGAYGSSRTDNYAVKMRGVSEEDEDKRARSSDTQQALTGGAERNERPPSKSNEQPRQNGIRLAPGTRISMTLLEPLQSGIATTAQARVDAEVKGSNGETLLRPGTIISIPFMALHANGRMMNELGEEIEIKTAAGGALILKGSVKGADGLVGIPGHLTKTGTGSTIGKIARGAARAGMSSVRMVAGSQAGISDIEREAGEITGLEDAVYGRYGSPRAQKEVVNIQAGVRFTFVIGK